jgi:lactoylglutathione lyase
MHTGFMPTYLHTMIRVTDPEKSRAFYEALGMEFRREMTNYFMGFPGEDAELELTHNTDDRRYELGDAYGHVAIGVEDLDGTLARLAEQGIEPEREPYRVRDGGSRLCFVRDPDSYRVEIIERS